MFFTQGLVPKVTLACAASILLAGTSSADTVVLPATSFDSYSDLETYWNYLYPWGDTHNGAARMVGSSTDHDHISVSNGVLTLTANPYNESDTIKYLSGTIYAKEQVNVTAGVGYQVEGEFIAPTVTGTWPAFWLNAASGWPPESDIGEWKGSAKNNFNTFNTSSVVQSTIVDWPTDGDFHSLKAVLKTIDGDDSDVSIAYYLDNTLQATHVAANYRNQAMNLIIDLQMEGSSGSPGPTTATTFQVRNVQITQIDI